MKASVIIPNWNGCKLLQVCLDSLFKQELSGDFEVIVVDNGSVDGSVEFIEKNFPKVNVIKNSENSGFAKGINKGILASKGEYIALLNNDTEADRFWLANLCRVMDSKKDVGFCASRMMKFYEREIIDSAGDRINIVGQGDAIAAGEKLTEKFMISSYVFSSCAGAAIYRRELFTKVGLFDEEFFSYFEDLDLAFRAQMQGFKCLYVPEAVVYHIHGATSNKNLHLREYLQFRNTWQIVLKDFPLQFFFRRKRWWKVPAVFLNTIHYFFKHGYGKEALRVVWYLLVNFPRLMHFRRIVQKSRMVPIDYLEGLTHDKRIKIWKWYFQ